MNKSIPFLINSFLFIAGIGSLILKLPFLCAGCLLAISLLFIWNSGIFFNKEPDLSDCNIEKITDGENARHMELSQRVQELSETNDRLVMEKQQLMLEIEDYKSVQQNIPHPFYTCPLTSSLPVNLNHFFTKYINNHENTLEKYGIHAEYHCSDPDAETYLSSSALTIILDNIFDNILKFGSRNENVYIRITKIEGDSLIILKNAGEGLNEKEVSRIFELNYQGSNCRTGNGLGLSQVKAVMDDFGGQVWGKSSSGSGFALYLQLPERQRQS